MQNYYRKMKVGKFMGKVISIGNQEFDTIREKECFFVDKTNFIKEWWEKEVFDSLDDFGMGDKKEIVKQWYDGFTFGGYRDIYNPWSITNYLKEKKIRPYWASTSSNGLVGKLIRKASVNLKEKMEDLLNGHSIVVNFDEQIVFEQLDHNESAIWSLLLASGYLKV